MTPLTVPAAETVSPPAQGDKAQVARSPISPDNPSAVAPVSAFPPDHQILVGAVGLAGIIIVLLSAVALSFKRLNRRMAQNVDLHQRTLEELRSSEHKYSSVFQLLPDMVAIARAKDGIFLEVNQGFERVTGWKREEVVNRGCVDLGLWEEKTRSDAVEEVMAKGFLQDYEFTLTTKSGAKRQAAMYLVPVTVEEIPCLFLLARDITEKKLMEQRREEDRCFVQAVLDSIPDMIFIKDRGSIYLGCNESYARRYIGRPKEEVIGRRDPEINSDAELVQHFIASDRKVMESGRVAQLEFELTLASGEKTFVEVLKTPFYQASGQIGGVIGIARDITAHKRILAEITREKETAQRYLDIAGVMFCALDKKGEIVLINRKGCQILGYESDLELVGGDWFQLCVPASVRPKMREIFTLQLASNTEAYQFFEIEVLTSAGEERLMAFHSTLLRDESGVSGVLFSGEDITDQRLLQAEILKSQKLESLGVLAGGIAHDFNNILTAIMGNLSLATMHTHPSDRSYTALSRAEKAVDRAADLAKRLLVFAKGGLPVKKNISLQYLIQETLSLSLSGTNVQGVVVIPEPLQVVEADEGQVSQSLHNIILNAVQAMPEGGVLSVRGENITLGHGALAGLPPGAYVRLTITDTGCGIAEENLKRIFDPYFTTKMGGTGLGLASTHAIIKNHRGHIGVSSVPGHGTSFTILLPSLGTAWEDQGNPSRAIEAGNEGVSVLVMDDEEMVRDVARRSLEGLGYSVTTCASGAEAVSLYQVAKHDGNPFNVVITDLTIPGGMGGVEACRQIRALDPEALLVVTSGYSDDPVMANWADYGFCASIQKPFRVSQISDVLCRVTGRICR